MAYGRCIRKDGESAIEIDSDAPQVVWLILYLRWQYEMKLKQDTERAREEEASTALAARVDKQGNSHEP